MVETTYSYILYWGVGLAIKRRMCYGVSASSSGSSPKVSTLGLDEVTLETPDDVFVFTVSKAEFEEDLHDDPLILFRGLDPYDCPEQLHEHFRFHSKDLTAVIETPDIIEDLSINPIFTSTQSDE